MELVVAKPVHVEEVLQGVTQSRVVYVTMAGKVIYYTSFLHYEVLNHFFFYFGNLECSESFSLRKGSVTFRGFSL